MPAPRVLLTAAVYPAVVALSCAASRCPVLLSVSWLPTVSFPALPSRAGSSPICFQGKVPWTAPGGVEPLDLCPPILTSRRMPMRDAPHAGVVLTSVVRSADRLSHTVRFAGSRSKSWSQALTRLKSPNPCPSQTPNQRVLPSWKNDVMVRMRSSDGASPPHVRA